MPGFTAEEDAIILVLLNCGVSISRIAREIGRTRGACGARSMRLRGLYVPGGGGVVINSRRCHDCGRQTSDYRCPKCLAKWRKKHGVGRDAHEEEGL